MDRVAVCGTADPSSILGGCTRRSVGVVEPASPAGRRACTYTFGGVPERLNGQVSKTLGVARLTRVQISPPPHCQLIMIKEYSAGGIVFKKKKKKGPSTSLRTKAHKQSVLWLVCQHSQHKGWVFPKGFIGDKIAGESIENTALREVEEETGVKARLLEKLPDTAGYFYVFNKEKRFKTVHYFLMKYTSGDITKHDFEMQDVAWWDEAKVKKDLTYKSDKKAFEQALKLFKKMQD
jgi:ADP-ribose pyrophosphatase YjhB (NUDIX family)